MQTWAERDRGGAVSNEEIGLTFSSGAMFAPGDYKSGQTTDILVLPFFLRLRDGFTPSIGTAKQIGKDAHELFAALSGPISGTLKMTGSGIAGLSKGSPDDGLGLSARLN